MRVEGVLQAKGSDVVSVGPDTTLHEAAVVLRSRRIGAVLVRNDDGELKGILSERDIVTAIAEKGALALASAVSTVMTSDVVSCLPSDTVEALMVVMTDHRIRHLPVVAEGRLLGIVSIGDVVKRRLSEVSDEAKALQDYITLGR